MNVSKKCQYALRAILELAKQRGSGLTRTPEIARAQAIPLKFLELILGELKQGGFVESRRGPKGGYLLAREPEDLSPGQIIRYIDGPIAPVQCVVDLNSVNCPLQERCVLLDMWTQAAQAVSDVYDGVTFQDLLEKQKNLTQEFVANFNI